MKKIEGVEFLNVGIKFYSQVPNGCLNLGHVRLENEGRSFVLDTVSSEYFSTTQKPEEGMLGTEVEVQLEAGIDGDEELENSNFDLTLADLHSDTLKATLYWEEAVEVTDGEFDEPESVTLFVRFNSSMTKAIDLEQEY